MPAIFNMNKSDKDLGYHKINQFKIKKLTQLIKYLFKKEDEYFSEVEIEFKKL